MNVLAATVNTGWRLLTRLVAPVMALVLLVGFAAFKFSDVPLVSVCGGRSVVSAGSNLVAGPASWARSLGQFANELAEHPEVYASPDAVRENVDGTTDVLRVWWRSFVGAVRGEPADPMVERLAQAAKDQAVTSVKSCLPCPGATGTQPSATSLASDETPATGDEARVVARAAVEAAGFPADQVATAMGVAGAESSYRPNAQLHYGGTTMDGLFQINRRAHPEFAGQDLMDPVANARAAYRVWVAAGRSWSPWSTYTSGAYRSHMSETDQQVVTSRPGESNTTTSMPGVPAAPLLPGLGQALAGCAGSGSGGPTGGVITWNTYVDNSDGNVLRGLEAMRSKASVICLQEVSASARRAAIRGDMAGWKMIGEDTAQPCMVDESKQRIVSLGAEVAIDGDQRMDARADGQRTNGQRWVVWATFDEVGTGVRWSVVNTHQIPTISAGNRMRYAKRLVQLVADKTTELKASGAVVQTGDMNDESDTAGALAPVGLVDTSSVLGPIRSHDIDKVRTTGATPVRQELLPRYGSDHAPRLVLFAPATQNVVDGAGADAVSSGVRVVRDPTSGVSYSVRMPSDPRRVAALNFAFDQLGKPYVWGAKGPNSYDCSGLMHAAWGAAGVDVYPQTETLVRQFTHVATPQPGDLTYHPGHTQMVVGTIAGKQIILEAPRPGRDVTIRPQWMTATAYLDPTQKVA